MNNPALMFGAHIAQPKNSWRRYAGLAFAVAFNGLLVWVLATSLVVKLGIYTPPALDMKVINMPQTQQQQTPPAPKPQLEKVIPTEPQVPPPVIQVAPETQVTPIQVQQQPQTPPATDASASGLTSTHTIPPYPPMARRLNQAGTVILSITIGTDGSVTAAAIQTSSGFPELDQTALNWVKTHWRYKPALQGGVAVPSTTQAAVKFDLRQAG